MARQKTIRKVVKVKGAGIHTGKKTELCFKPAQENTGINFVRVDLSGRPVIRACVDNVVEESLSLRRTSLGAASAEVHTVEHLLSALFGLGIDNIIIEVNGEEIPALDGAAAHFCNILKQAEIIELDSVKDAFVVREPFWIKEGDAFLAVFPDERMRISYTLDYPETNLHQYLSLLITEQNFAKELVLCKTFCLETEVEPLLAQGLGRGATVENTVVVGKKGIVEGKATFDNEFVRHKVLDIIGDFCLLAPEIKAHVVAVKSGHPLNIQLLKKLNGSGLKSRQAKLSRDDDSQSVLPPFGIKRIMQILPHRYPFLLVDKVLKLEEGKHIVGVKNVTVNEQFFTGHFPEHPIMPGVLIVEAMAQTAGILMLSRPENRGKLAYFMSIDKVKFRKIVLPGDQLLMHIDVIRIKSRTIQISGRAFVEDKVVAEAEMMFSLVPKDV